MEKSWGTVQLFERRKRAGGIFGSVVKVKEEWE